MEQLALPGFEESKMSSLEFEEWKMGQCIDKDDFVCTYLLRYHLEFVIIAMEASHLQFVIVAICEPISGFTSQFPDLF